MNAGLAFRREKRRSGSVVGQVQARRSGWRVRLPAGGRSGVLWALLLASGLGLTIAEPGAGRQPNFLLIVADDVGVSDFGFSGGTDIPTPHLDRLAREGVVCSAGYVQPMCAPTRAMLLSGRYPQEWGYEDNRPFDGPHSGLSRDIPTLPGSLRSAGYATALVGKWHLGRGDRFEYAPRNRGFDEFFGYFGAFGSYLNPVYSRNGVESAHPGYGTDILTDEAIARIRAWKGRPFFLHLAFTAAHLKQEAKPEDLARFAHIGDARRRMAAAIVSNLDGNIGRLMDAIREAGIAEETLTFFLSDNGGEPLVLGTRNGPFRGQKFDLYEGGVRVPWLMHWPGRLPAGRREDRPVSAMDVMPTCLALAGAAPVATRGVNLMPFLSGETNEPPHEFLFWRTTQHADWRRAREEDREPPRLSAVRQGDWKLLVFEGRGKEGLELYHLAADPGETANLAGSEPDRVQRMAAELARWRETLPPPLTGAILSLGDAPGRWTRERAAAWHGGQPFLAGANFTPSTAGNQIEMWRAETFDPACIERELGFARALGFNSMRVFLHDLLWKHDSAGLLERMDRFLALADRQGIRPVFVFFDSCWDPYPRWGAQPRPRPHTHNPVWVQSPGVAVLGDPEQQAHLKPYVQGVLRRFGQDPRVLAWDLWNEPDNFDGGVRATPPEPHNKPALVLPLLRSAFAWAREVNPSQPLTSAVWRQPGNLDSLDATKRVQLENSDVISFHCYAKEAEFRGVLSSLERLGRPLWCTEYMARDGGGQFKPLLEWMRERKVAAYCWDLVDGRTQTIYPVRSWRQPFHAPPEVWNNCILRPDGTPFSREEADYLRSILLGGARSP